MGKHCQPGCQDAEYALLLHQYLRRCAQGKELLQLVTLFWEEESGLRSIRESEAEIENALKYSRNCILFFLGEDSQEDRKHVKRDSLSFLHPAECGDLKV